MVFWLPPWFDVLLCAVLCCCVDLLWRFAVLVVCCGVDAAAVLLFRCLLCVAMSCCRVGVVAVLLVCCDADVL